MKQLSIFSPENNGWRLEDNQYLFNWFDWYQLPDIVTEPFEKQLLEIIFILCSRYKEITGRRWVFGFYCTLCLLGNSKITHIQLSVGGNMCIFQFSNEE